jgi:general secretion pathway protein D
MKIQFKQALLWLLMCLLAGCASHSVEPVDRFKNQPPVSIKPSYLKQDTTSAETDSQTDVLNLSVEPRESASTNDLTMTELDSIPWPDTSPRSTPNIADKFSDDGALVVAAERMSIRDFVHYVFGELLQVNYVLDESILSDDQSDNNNVTLNLSDPVGRRTLFDLTSDVLLSNGVEISYGSDTFFILKSEGPEAQRPVIGIGGKISDIPNTNREILQVVPLKYGVRLAVERTIRGLVKAKLTPDNEQSVIFIQGSRADIVQAIELIDLLDTPATRSRHIGLVGLTFLEPNQFATDAVVLLENEGIIASVGAPAERSVVLVPLENLGSVAVFSTTEAALQRVRYWADIIDQPVEGSSQQYFLYNPKYARAVDLGASIGALIGSGSSVVGAKQSAAGNNTGNAPSPKRTAAAQSGDVKMVIDERANALVFFTSGSKYRTLLPLLEKLDTMPKQILLDITIAEVSLQDEFKYGFEWALSRGEVTLTTDGAFGVSDIGGMGLLINGSEGPLKANFLNSNSLVNVLSNPTLMVRDGVSANINVGSDISVVGQTTQDPISGQRQTTTSEYRQTGVDVTVTPTVNAKGIVVMEISQSISNSVPSSSGAGGNPDIFERSLSTELVAKSGQTVMMAGLVSENTSVGGSGTPAISKLPLVGGLFKSKSDSVDRTELVMLITPRVLETLDEWDDIIEDFRSGLNYLKLER